MLWQLPGTPQGRMRLPRTLHSLDPSGMLCFTPLLLHNKIMSLMHGLQLQQSAAVAFARGKPFSEDSCRIPEMLPSSAPTCFCL